ncbi:ubiquitin-binding protein Rv1468c-like isoform X2 [Centrocercus urophasianus]|uniref:ubiquitin-binding protein Rv1468c-like isoform X2 n=1 Tax=Centrocercus urophasianus TaxID=9002 RepID=UPI001C64C947|nr:ubiquitin-binding protein Rv1468c-like isoform X2 [Centrocercus urophasianus]
MKGQICVAVLAVCLLVLGGTNALPLDWNQVGEGGFNNGEPQGTLGNGGGLGGIAGQTFSDNGVGFVPPAVYNPQGTLGNGIGFDGNPAGWPELQSPYEQL